jgi:3',5'-cyclic AMP phosphodiesterase CpdA
MSCFKNVLIMLLALGATGVFAEDKQKGPGPGQGGGGGRRGGAGGLKPEDAPADDVRFIFKTEVPAHPFDVVLGRPTNHSVTASVLAYEDCEGVIEFSPKAGEAPSKTPVFQLKAGQPQEVLINGLKADTAYSYRLGIRKAGGAWTAGELSAFQTQRAPGKAFVFTIQADPHLDYNTEPALYLRCLANVLADRPDFHIDLGDTFMTDKHRGRETAAAQYVAQRFYFGQLSHSAPLFLVPGNHDGESGRWLDGTSGNLAVWSNAMRKKYFPNPIPDGFFSGNQKPDPVAGVLQNYYAFEWGDALFVVLDPFWFTARAKGGSEENWSRTLGREQYDWLASTLSTSRARHRFVFLHHLVGGNGREARGGTVAAPLYEWGGRSPDGTSQFKEKRPGWPMPIHEMLLKGGVNIVFHGHDHLYVREELDGIVYQAVPQPGNGRYDNTRSAAEYGYTSGVVQGSSGHLRVSVGAEQATVDYVRAFLPGDESGARKNGAVTQSYSVKGR